MKIKLVKPTKCAHDEHEERLYPRPWFVAKPILQEGTVLDVDKKWSNFYGTYYRCGDYDIPIDNAVLLVN